MVKFTHFFFQGAWKRWTLGLLCASTLGLMEFAPVANANPVIDNVTEITDSSNQPSDMLFSRGSKKNNKKNKNKKNQNSKVPGFVDIANVPPATNGAVRLASWNMHDLFDTIDDDNKDEVLTPAEYNDKLNALAKVLRNMKADIVGVQEIENATCLRDLAARAGFSHYVLVEGNDKVRGIDVGLLSKIPIKNYVTHAKDNCGAGPNGRHYQFSRDCLEVHFDHPSKLVMLVNHFKSKRGDQDQETTPLRRAQAQRVRDIANTLSKRPVLIVGDFNDEPDSKAITPLVTAPGFHDVLSWIGANRVTFHTKRYRSALDYLVMNDMLYKGYVPKSAQIVVGQAVKDASDHRPVFVDVKL